PKEIIFKLAQIEAKATKGGCANTSCEIGSSAAAFASMFAAIRRGQSINLSDAENATSQIINSIEKNGLSSWLDDVRRYHEGTFQHSLRVPGVLDAFPPQTGSTNPDANGFGTRTTQHHLGQ